MKVNYTEPFNFKPISCITPLDNYWQNGTWKFGSLEITPDTAYQPSFIDIILKGTTALTLVNAKANSLQYLKLYGGCEQNGTPTPSSPVDIVCNNGTIKYSLNEFDVSKVEVGYYRVQATGVLTPSPYNFITGYMPVIAGARYVCYGRRKSDNKLSSYNRIHWFDANKEFISTSNYTVNTISKGTAPSNAVYAQCSINESGSTTAVTTMEIVEGYNWVFELGTAEVPYTPYVEGGIYIDGTTETVKDSLNNTATAQNLFAVGTYKDVQEVLTGAVTRNVGVKVFDGTETFNTSNATFTYTIRNKVSAKTTVLCSHFEYSTKTSSQVEDGKIISFASTNVGFRYDACADTTAFKNWLKSQYDNGTPVIVLYPLDTATTSSVTAQSLNIQAGTNIIEITQASIDGLELEVKYKAGVEVTIEEVENAQLDNNVEVTIQ